MKIPSRKKPILGIHRAVKRFLFLPKRLPTIEGIEETRWLEMAIIEQVFTKKVFIGIEPPPSTYNGWIDVRWMN